MSKAEKLEIEVRRATPEDIPSIVALDHQTLGIAHWSERVYGAIFESTSPLRMAWVALEPGQAEGLRGFLVAGVSAGHCQLENLAVAGGWRGRGIGSALVKRFLAEARALDLESITLEVRQSNQVARALYEKYGFAMSGRRRSYYRDPEEDAILYALTHS